MKIGEADIQRIIYGFNNNLFSTVFIDFAEFNNFLLIKKNLFQLYGIIPQTVKNTEDYLWLGKLVSIHLRFDELTKKGSLSYLYRPPVDKSTEAEKSCWSLGNKFGYCGTLSFHGLPCRPEDDVVIPVECRNNPQTNLGIR